MLADTRCRLASEARRISGELKDQRTEASCLHAIASAYDIIDQMLAENEGFCMFFCFWTLSWVRSIWWHYRMDVSRFVWGSHSLHGTVM